MRRTETGLPARLWTAYRRTQYSAGGIVLRIGRRSAQADALLARHGARTAVLLTAWNPLSRRMPEGWNHRMQRALHGRLRLHATLPGEGAWRRWREAHLLALGPIPPLLGMARCFRQRAVVVLARGQTVRLTTVDLCRAGIRLAG